MKRKLLALGLAAAMSVSLLAGCGSAGSSSQAGSTGGSSTGGEAASGGSVYYLNFKPRRMPSGRPWPKPTPNRPACRSPWSPRPAATTRPC